jgi:transmembrane sensor
MPSASQSKTPPIQWATDPTRLDRVVSLIEVKIAKQKRRRARGVKAVAALVILAGFGFWAVPTYRDTAAFATLAAHRQTLALLDGSTAELNAGTSVHTDFRYGRRRVALDHGEAFFSVAKDATHPFLVETPAGTVRVTGTHFNVRVAADGIPEVTLLEGKVAFQPATGVEADLTPGEQYDAKTQTVRTLTPAELEGVTAWRDGRLILDGLNLAEAAARMSAYHGREIIVDPAVASLRMGGGIALDDLSGFIAFLPQALSVQVLANPDGSFRVVAQKLAR